MCVVFLHIYLLKLISVRGFGEYFPQIDGDVSQLVQVGDDIKCQRCLAVKRAKKGFNTFA